MTNQLTHCRDFCPGTAVSFRIYLYTLRYSTFLKGKRFPPRVFFLYKYTESIHIYLLPLDVGGK